MTTFVLRLLGALYVSAALYEPAWAARTAAPFHVAIRDAARDGRDRELRRLVLRSRAHAYETITMLLDTPKPDSVAIARSVAVAYRDVYRDGRPLERVTTFASYDAQSLARFREAASLRNAGQDHNSAGRLGEAAGEFERALPIAVSLGDAHRAGRLENDLAGVATMERRSAIALAGYDRALRHVEQSGDLALRSAVEMNRSLSLLDLGRIGEARSSLAAAIEAARAMGDAGGEANARLNLGEVLTSQGELAEAGRVLREAILLARRAEEPDTECTAWLNLGNVFRLQEDLPAARRAITSSLAAAEAAGLGLATVDAERGLIELCQETGDIAGARRHLDRVKEVLGTVDSPMATGQVAVLAANQELLEDRPDLAVRAAHDALESFDAVDALVFESDAWAMVAEGSRRLGDYDVAIDALQTSIEAASRAGRDDVSSRRWMALGELLVEFGDVPRGLSALDRAVEERKRVGEESEVCRIQAEIAGVRLRAGVTARALPSLRAALDCLERHGDHGWALQARLALLASEIPATAERTDGILEALGAARGLAAMSGNRRSAITADLLETEQCLAVGRVTAARAALERGLRAQRDARSFDRNWVFDTLGARLALAEGSPSKALRLATRAVSEAEATRRKLSGDLDRAAFLEQRIAPYRLVIELESRAGRPVAAYDAARLAKARTLADRIAPRPIGPDTASPSLAALQALIRPDERVVDFFILEHETLAFVVGRSIFVMRRLPIGSTRLGALSATARFPGRPGSGDSTVVGSWSRAMSTLAHELFDPLWNDVVGARRLVLVPNGGLHDVPLASLAHGDRFLFESHVVSVIPSIDLLTRRGTGLAPERGLMALGNPAGRSDVDRLPHAGREIQSVARLGGPGTMIAEGDLASETAFRREASRFATIHVAAHGRLDAASPWRSWIELAPGEGTDGRLTASEISRLELAARTVVLSGCSTAADPGLVRDDAPGDERGGLARAFLVAGARSVVGTLWDLEDSAAAVTMPAIYRDGIPIPDPAAAVGRLQSDLVRERIRAADGSSLGHPFYWAAFETLGAGY